MKKAWNLGLVLQIVQKISEKICPCLYLSIDQVSWVNELWFKGYIQKCPMSHVLILIMTSQIWWIIVVKNETWISWERNITFLWNKKTLYLCLRWHIFRSYHFAAEVTFKLTEETLVFKKEDELNKETYFPLAFFLAHVKYLKE